MAPMKPFVACAGCDLCKRLMGENEGRISCVLMDLLLLFNASGAHLISCLYLISNSREDGLLEMH
jgi:hypothetical protein